MIRRPASGYGDTALGVECALPALEHRSAQILPKPRKPGPWRRAFYWIRTGIRAGRLASG